MVRSSGACFKIISCGGDSVDHEDLQTPESKSSSEKHGWSFRKRSARHRVLSNTIISESPSSVKKESPESTDVNFLVQPNLSIPEKSSAIPKKEERTELSAEPASKLSDTIADKEDDSRADAIHDESSIIVIQAAIRRCLARRLLSKQKSIIRMQAAIRGHLVRSHAVGTLRCVQAIVKMQTLVRTRRARILVEESGDCEKQSESRIKESSVPRSTREAKSNDTHSYISIEKLLSNRFARQLMESTPKSKSINIKCDPLKSDSAWKWLERWMSVSSVSNGEILESGSVTELQGKNDVEHSEGKLEFVVPSDDLHEQSNSPGVEASAKVSVDDNLICEEGDNIDIQVCKSISPSSSHADLRNIDHLDLTRDVTEAVTNLEVEAKSHPTPSEMQETYLSSEVEAKSFPTKEETVHEIGVPDAEKALIEQPETETKKLSRKASNPAFLAAQSKFEELSSAANAAKVEASSHCDHGSEFNLDEMSSPTGPPCMSQEIESSANPVCNAPAVQIGGVDSECGTELSISSTLDSPDRSEVGINVIEQDKGNADESDHSTCGENFVLDINGTSGTLEPDPSYTNTDHLAMDDTGNSAVVEYDNSVTVVDSPPSEKKPGPDPSELQLELGSEANHPVNKQSPETSPRSRSSVTESQATPSSISLKPKKTSGEKNDSSRRNKSSSADKKSLPNSNQDSASRSSMEQLAKGHKSVKRRNSFGSAKPENADQEPRDSSSSNSLPSYMQATESARAKAISSGSPRSSPDVHEKDIYIKKRQSLPGSNGRQESPCIERSMSQAQQNAKGNGSHSPQERKWRR